MRRTREPPPRRRALVLSSLVAASLVACGQHDSVADFEVIAAVKRYNQVLPQAYARASAGLLTETATADEMRRVSDLIGFLAQGRMVMDARQEAFEAVKVVREATERAALEATEVWWYRHWVPATSEVRQAPRRVRYRNRYHCLRVEGRWLVDRLEELGFEDLPVAAKPKG